MNVFQLWHYFWATIGCFLNGLLIFVAVYKSPKAIRTYATLIINFGLTDFSECLLDVFTQIRLLPAPGDITMTYIFNGFCKYVSEISCQIGASFFLHCIPHSVWSLLLSFSYRYYILHNFVLTRKQLICILIIVYIPSLIQGLTYWTNFVGRDTILPLAIKIFPRYNFSQETGMISGIVDVTSITAIYGIVHMTFPIFPIYTIIYILRNKIIDHLRENTQSMSPETKTVHKQMLRALTFQSFTPVFVWIGATCYLITQLGIIQQSPIMEYSVFVVAIMMPVLSPFTYLLFVRPYKKYCLKKFCFIIGAGKGEMSKAESTNHPSNGFAISKITSSY